MQANHVVVWLDHSDAHIIAFSRDAAEVPVIVHSAKHNVHQHERSDRTGPSKSVGNPDYYDAIIDKIRTVPAWLVVGPSDAKLAFSRHLTHRHADLADHLIGLETVDHPSDGQLLAYAKKYFIATDNMAADPVPA